MGGWGMGKRWRLWRGKIRSDHWLQSVGKVLAGVGDGDGKSELKNQKIRIDNAKKSDSKSQLSVSVWGVPHDMVEVATQSVAGKSLKNSGTLVLHQERVAENKTPVGWFQTPTWFFDADSFTKAQPSHLASGGVVASGSALIAPPASTTRFSTAQMGSGCL